MALPTETPSATLVLQRSPAVFPMGLRYGEFTLWARRLMSTAQRNRYPVDRSQPTQTSFRQTISKLSEGAPTSTFTSSFQRMEPGSFRVPIIHCWRETFSVVGSWAAFGSCSLGCPSRFTTPGHLIQSLKIGRAHV